MSERTRRNAAADEPASKSHPFFPDQVWPYPILVAVVLMLLGLLAVVGQAELQPGPAADPRAALIPRPEWYFLALFQFAKLGPALLTTILVPTLLAGGLVFWPLLDASIGPRLARRLGWSAWPVPKRNVITGTIWIAVLAVVAVLTFWAAFAPQLCLAWPLNGPICGG